MSLCSRTVRTISFSSSSIPRSLLPFLYQTITIQQWQSTVQTVRRRNFTSRSKPKDELPFEEWFRDDETQSPHKSTFAKPATQRHSYRSTPRRSSPEDDVPFEGEVRDLAPMAIEPQSGRGTTMTRSERAAFEKLYKTFNTQGQGRSKSQSGEHEELDQIADEYWEDDDDTSGKTVDKAFEAVLQGAPRSHSVVEGEASASPAPETVDPGKAKVMAAREKIRAESLRIKTYRQAEYQRVNQLLESAQTDHELWSILEREIFDQLRSIDLGQPDSMTSPVIRARKAKQKPPGPLDDKRFLFRNHPRHIIKAILVLRENFPASPLPFNIVPTIKAIGRAPYALCVTTILYKHLIRAAWIQQSSYSLIDKLLSEMDANVIPFDYGILALLDRIVSEHEQARGGVFGRGAQMVYDMDIWIEGLRKMKAWRNFVVNRLGEK